jgi:subtilisin family serine protease
MENIFSVISKITLIFTWNPFSMTIFNFQYKKTALLLLFTALNLGLIWGQTSDFLGFNFETFASKHPEEKICLSATNSTSNKRALASIGIQVKYESPNFLFFNASHKELSALKENQSIQGLYFSFSRPKSLGDSSLLKHKVNWVHQGLNGIDTNYTGKGIIVGIVDQGIDFNHPDFKTNTGKTRVLRYWDHTVNGPNPPQPYNYGTVWDSSSINNGTCTSLETVTAHGTTVAGMAADTKTLQS